MTTNNVIRTSRRRRRAGFEGFRFTQEQLSDGPGILGTYRAKAWEIFDSLPYPSTKDEAWRRTDIRNLDGSVNLPSGEAYLDLQSYYSRFFILTSALFCEKA